MRLRQQLVCPEHGKVEKEDIVKGYEFEKDKYVVIDDTDLEKIRLETTKTIEVAQFVDASAVDPIYFNSAYYVAPDGPVAEEGFRVLREAMRQTNKIALGRVVISNKEQVVALKCEDKGLVLNTLHYKEEVRSPAAYFEEIRNGSLDKNQLKLATQLVETFTAPFDPTQFSDRYQDSLLEIIKGKIEGSEPAISPKAEMGKVINLMDALKQSLEQTTGQKKKPPAASIKSVAKKPKIRTGS
jgi:DNA end-binding protein Ku